jgi:hypothetical protein
MGGNCWSLETPLSEQLLAGTITSHDSSVYAAEKSLQSSFCISNSSSSKFRIQNDDELFEIQNEDSKLCISNSSSSKFGIDSEFADQLST